MEEVQLDGYIVLCNHDRTCDFWHRYCKGVTVEGFPNGNFVGPTVLSGVTSDMECYTEEIFGTLVASATHSLLRFIPIKNLTLNVFVGIGPVLVCLTVDTLEEAIELTNRY